MRHSKEARKHDYDFEHFDLKHKIEGPTWGIFLANLDDAGFYFNDIYYERPHKFIDAFFGDTGCQIKVKSIHNIGYDTYEVDDIVRSEIMEESCEDLDDEDDEDEDETLEESEDTEVLEEADRFTHRIVILPKDAKVQWNQTTQKRLRFKSYEEAENYMNQLLAGGSLATKLKNRGLTLGVEEIPKPVRKTGTNDPDYENPFEVDDILFGDVGYSMQIPEWYQVVSKTPKSVTCRRLNARVEGHDGYGQRGEMRPIPGSFYHSEGMVNGKRADAPVTMRVKKWGGQVSSWRGPGKDQYYASLGGSRYGNIFSIWDGKSKPFDYYD